MKTVNTLKAELADVELAQNLCVYESGVVRPECRYRYQALVQQAQNIQGEIAFMASQPKEASYVA